MHYKDTGYAESLLFLPVSVQKHSHNSRSGKIVQRVLCGHELGHSILHTELAALHGFQEIELFESSVPAEYEANLFAAELIIPDNDLFELLNDKDKTFFSIAKELYVPAELLDFKFRILKNKGYHLEAPFIAQPNFLKNDIAGYDLD